MEEFIMECQVYLLKTGEGAGDQILPSNEESINDVEIQSQIEYYEECVRIAIESGFVWQAEIHREKIAEIKRNLLPRPPFPEVTEQEWEVYKRFLPTAYTKASYRYDAVPLGVMMVIREYEHYFTRIEIRTPEEQDSDPVAFGIIEKDGKEKKCRIASWSERRVLEVEDMLDELIRKTEDSMRHFKRRTSFFGGGPIIALLAGIAILFFSSEVSFISGIGVIFILAGVLVGMGLIMVSRELYSPLRRSKKELEAIQL